LASLRSRMSREAAKLSSNSKLKTTFTRFLSLKPLTLSRNGLKKSRLPLRHLPHLPLHHQRTLTLRQMKRTRMLKTRNPSPLLPPSKSMRHVNKRRPPPLKSTSSATPMPSPQLSAPSLRPLKLN
jgi:hypothetical protein